LINFAKITNIEIGGGIAISACADILRFNYDKKHDVLMFVGVID
jgi:hypothetical protein